MNAIASERLRAIQEKAFKGLIAFADAMIEPKGKFLAMHAFAFLPFPQARDKAIDLFRAFPEDEDSIAGLGKFKCDPAAAALATRLRQKKALNRDLIVEQLAGFQSQVAFDALKEMLSDHDRHVRFQAVHGLFRFKGKDAALALCPLIADPDEWISMTTLKLLCQMKEHETIPYLTGQYKKDTDLRRKAIMVSFLSLFRSVTLVGLFDEGLQSRDQRLKANAIEAIGDLELSQREIDSRIKPYIHDPNNRIRANTILALAKSDPTTARSEIAQMVGSNDAQLRRSAAYILGQIPCQGWEEGALSLLRDASDDVRRRMVLSLKNFPADFARTQLETSINDPSKWIRKFSVEMAAEYPEFSTAAILKQMKRETTAQNIIACLNFFTRRPDPKALSSISHKIREGREPIVSTAIKAAAAVNGMDGLKEVPPQIYLQDARTLQTFMSLSFSLGNIEVFDNVIEKATNPNRFPQAMLFLPAFIRCLEILSQDDKLPEPVLQKLSQVVIPAAVEVPVTLAPEPIPGTDPGKVSGIVTSPVVPRTEPAPPVAPEPGMLSLENIGEEEKDTGPKLPKPFSKAVRLYNLGSLKKARERFVALLQECPEVKKTHLYLGLIAVDEKKFEEARDALVLYLEHVPDDPRGSLALARAYKSLRDWPKLLQMTQRLLAKPDDLPPKSLPRIQRDYGIALYFGREYQKGQEVLGKLAKGKEVSIEGFFYLAMAHFQQKHFGDAASWLNQVLKIAPPKSPFHKMAETSLQKVQEILKPQKT